MSLAKSCLAIMFILFYDPQLYASQNSVHLTAQERAWIQTHPQIITGGTQEWYPFDFITKEGDRSGIAADYLKLIAQRTGLNITPNTDTWNHNLQKIKNKKIDLLPAIYFSENRRQFLSYSSPYFEILDYFFIREDLDVETLADLDGKRVAIPKGYIHIDVIKEHFPKIQIMTVNTAVDAIEAVLENRADILFDTYTSLSYTLKQKGINTIIPFKSTRHLGIKYLHFASRKGAPELASIIQKGLDSISPQERQEIYHKWLGALQKTKDTKLVLSIEEQQWLDNHQNIRFSGDPNWLPYEAFDLNGNYIGIVADHLKIIEQRLGIKLKIIPTKTWAESLENIKLGKIDVLSETSDSGLQAQLSFTDDYIYSPVIMVMKNNTDYIENIEQIKHLKIAVIKDYGYISEIIKQHPNLDLYYIETIQDGLAAVATGKVEVLLATLAQASYHISELGINNIRIVGKTEFTTKLAFGMKKEFAPLIPLFNRALHSISPNEKQAIFDKWGKGKFIEHTDYRWLAKVIGALLLFMLIMLYWNRKLAKEMTLRAEIEQQTKMLIDSIPIQIIVTALNGQLLSANPKAINDYNLDSNKLGQYNIAAFYADIDGRKEVLKELRDHAKIEHKIIPMKQPNGKIYSMMASIMPIKYQKQPALLSIAVNMTERLEIEATLKLAKRDAESANRAKSEFLANMSHEIRTPMNAIIGFTELLNEQIDDPKLKSFVKIIQTAGNNLLVLINDILDLSKIEAGKLHIKKTPCNPHDLFTELGNIFMLKMREKNIDFILDIDPLIPQSLYIDAPRLRQVLLNLIGNAVKFTDDGFIKIKVRTDNEDKIRSKVDLIINIEDSGIGISKDQQLLIFHDFEQSSGQDMRKYGGTGLGLSISKRLVEMMDGQLLLKSQINVGSTFTVKLTALDVTTLSIESETPKNKTHIEFNPAKILIVDDVQDNQRLLLAHFESTALQTMTAVNGFEAVNLAKQHAFDVIIMDIRMPVMNGYQAAEEIKSFSDTPIIALTASVMTDDFDRKKSDNFDGYLRKPILRAELINELCRFLTYTETESPEFQEKPSSLTAKEKAILPQLLFASEALSSLYEASTKSNNLSEIQQFSDALSSLTQQYPVSLMTEYSMQLQQAVERFDITAIKQALNTYPELITKLKLQT